jgi:hypothetical protein
MDVREMELEALNWIYMDQWLTLVNTAVNILVPQITGSSWLVEQLHYQANPTL